MLIHNQNIHYVYLCITCNVFTFIFLSLMVQMKPMEELDRKEMVHMSVQVPQDSKQTVLPVNTSSEY